MEQYARDMGRELRQRQRALATGALVRPPKNAHELALEESANEAEIDMLVARRGRLWSLMGGGLSDSERNNLSYDVGSASRGLEIAFAAKRRLAVARSLLEGSFFV